MRTTNSSMAKEAKDVRGVPPPPSAARPEGAEDASSKKQATSAAGENLDARQELSDVVRARHGGLGCAIFMAGLGIFVVNKAGHDVDGRPATSIDVEAEAGGRHPWTRTRTSGRDPFAVAAQGAQFDGGRCVNYVLDPRWAIGLTGGLFAFGIKMTHKVAGPLFKIAQLSATRSRPTGKFDKLWNLRKGDQLVELPYENFKSAHEHAAQQQQERDVAALERAARRRRARRARGEVARSRDLAHRAPPASSSGRARRCLGPEVARVRSATSGTLRNYILDWSDPGPLHGRRQRSSPRFICGIASGHLIWNQGNAREPDDRGGDGRLRSRSCKPPGALDAAAQRSLAAASSWAGICTSS